MVGTMEISQANTTGNQNTFPKLEKWQRFDYKLHNKMESWDQFVLRKMKEEREYYDSRKDMGNN